MSKDTVGPVERTVVRDSEDHTVRVDYTRHHADGTSTTKQYEAEDTFFGVHEGQRIGVAESSPDGTTTYKPA